MVPQARANAVGGEVSGLRAARLAIPATQEQVCADLDKLSQTGSSGVTASMLSGWERGRHTTSIKYRQILAEYYGQTPEALFAHQDRHLSTASGQPGLLVGHADMTAAMIEIAHTAGSYLTVLGSRSRDPAYLAQIETVLAKRPKLVHYRILFGPPHHQMLKDHLVRLLTLRNPADRSHGVKTLHIAIIQDTTNFPERFFVASERGAVVPIPSLTSPAAFDSGVRFGAMLGERLIDHARQCYAAGRRIETPEAVHDLPIMRG